MDLTLTGKLENVFQSSEYTNTKSGETTPMKHSFQFLEEIQKGQGKQLVIHKINVPIETFNKFKDSVGDVISIPVKIWQMNGKVGYTGV